MKKQQLTVKKSKIKTRVTWGFNPAIRTIPLKKLYSRKKYKLTY